jgi:hypothetical protein
VLLLLLLLHSQAAGLAFTCEGNKCTLVRHPSPVSELQPKVLLLLCCCCCCWNTLLVCSTVTPSTINNNKTTEQQNIINRGMVLTSEVA